MRPDSEAPGPAAGPGFSPQPSGLPPGGPRRWWAGPEGVVVGGPPARVREELEGFERMGEHPARPRVRASGPDWILFEPLGEPPRAALEVVAAWPPGEPATLEGRVGALLEGLPGKVRVDRALERAGLKRRELDQLLASPARVRTALGPGPGGPHPLWLRQAGDRVVSLSGARASARSWWALELAAPALALGLDARAQHARVVGGDPRAADLALALAELRLRSDELVLGGGDPGALAAAAEAARGLLSPPEVRLTLEGAPDWFDASGHLPSGGLASPEQARRALRLLDGLSLGGHRLHLRCDPPLRPGRAPPPREPLATRRRRLFSRWAEGVQADDEGLYSATPEALADLMSRGLSGHVLDGTCGVGAWTLALARRPEVRRVLAVDTHAGRLDMARHNARLYGLDHRVDFLCADVAEVLADGRFDAMVLDPPWGGRTYDRDDYKLEDLGLDLPALLARGPAAAVLKLPRSFDVAQLGPGWRWRAMADGRGVIKFLEGRRAC